MDIIVYTDPTCPFAYSAEPIRWRLQWLYGDQLHWQQRMIVLNGYKGETSSLTPELVATYGQQISQKYGMPIDPAIKARIVVSAAACGNYVAIQRHDPAAADALLRNLRIASMSGQLIDEPLVLAQAIEQTGLLPVDVASWLDEPETETVLNQQAEAARQPSSVAQTFKRKLSTTSTDRLRYSAPSYVFSFDDKTVFELPGMWPLEAYEAAIDNFLPNSSRRADPVSVSEALAWADTPLATIEVATICARPTDDIRKELDQVATFEPVGLDGFWTLRS